MWTIIQKYSSTPDFIKQAALIVLLMAIIILVLGKKE